MCIPVCRYCLPACKAEMHGEKQQQNIIKDQDWKTRGVGGIDRRDEKSSSLYPTVCCLSSLRGVQWHTVNGIFKGGPRRERLSPAYRNQKA